MIIVKGRELLIPENERYIGTNYDAGMENRLFRIPRYSQSGTDLSDLTFKINLIFDGDPLDRAEMTKAVDDEYVYLTWTVSEEQVKVTGTVFVCVTGNDTNDTVKWSSFQAPFYTEKSLGDDIDTAYHDLVNKVAKEITDRESAVTAEKNAREAADTTLQQNINAEASARAAGDAAANTRIDNIVSQSGDDITEIVDARTGAYSVVHASLKARLDSENTDLKNQLMKSTTDNSVTVYDILAPWQRGRLDGSDGTIKAASYRIATTNLQQLGYDATFTVSSDYRMFFCLYDSSGTYLSHTGFITDPYKIPANQKFRMCIALRSGESSSVYADIHDFATGAYVSNLTYAEIKELRECIMNLESDYLDLSDQILFPSQIGAIESTTATADNTLIIGASTNRAVIGPVQMRHSFRMSPSSDVKYKMYRRVSTSNYNVFTDCYETWQEIPHIEGVNDQIYALTNYYIQIAYTDDSVITNLETLLGKFKIAYDDTNIYGLYETVGINDMGFPYGTPLTAGSSGIRLVSKKFDKALCTIAHTSKSNYRINALSGSDIYNASGVFSGFGYGTQSVYENEAMFAIQDYTNEQNGKILFRDYDTFADLYDAIGIEVEQHTVDFDHVTGFQSDDATRIVNAADVGNYIKTDIFASGICLNDDEAILFSHCPSITTDGNYIYIVFQGDRTIAQESANTTEIELAIVDAETLTVERYVTIAKSGTYGGMTFDGRCSYSASYIANGVLYIIFSGTVGGVQTLCLASYNTSTHEYTIEPCTISTASGAYTFNATNFVRYVGGIYGVAPYGYEIGVCNPVLYDGDYYTTVSTGNNPLTKTVILKSTNLVEWEIYDVLGGEGLASCEAVCGVYGHYLLIALRHEYKKCTTRILKYNITTKVTEQWAQVSSDASRPTIFSTEDRVFLVIPKTLRRTMEIYALSDNIRDSRLMVALYDWATLAYNSILYLNGAYYYAVQTKRTGANTVGTYPVIYFGKSSVSMP